MRRIIILNAKGGCGKTTVATNLASCYAGLGERTALIDYDPQGSSLQWLRARDPDLPMIQGVALHDSTRIPLAGAWQLKVPRETTRVVVDTPAGVRALDLVGRIRPHDTLLIPIQPSAVDVRATSDFVRDLLLVAKLRWEDRRIAFIGNRIRRNNPFVKTLRHFLDSLKIPAVVELRDTEGYAVAADKGCGISELSAARFRKDQEHWSALVAWLDGTDATDGKPVAPPHRTGPRASRSRDLPTATSSQSPVPRFLTQDWDADAVPPGADPKRLN